MAQSNANVNGKSLTVLMFPWLAHGHLSPFLELAKKLSQRNFVVYLCSTLANFASIRQKIKDVSCSHIRFIVLKLPKLKNLPARYHTTNRLPPHLMPALKEAFDLACPTFTKLLTQMKPDLLIYDVIQPWAAAAALRLKIPAVEFISSSVTMFTYTFHQSQNSGIEFPFSDAIYLHPYETSYACKLKDSSANADKVENRGLQSLKLSCKIVLFKSFKEIEGDYMEYFSGMTGKKVMPLGTLAQDPLEKDEESEIIQWLNTKDRGSTIFVSFGSEYFLSDEDLNEIAHGLEMSNLNFIWVVRFPINSDVSLEEKLPEGFLERVGERGKVEKWAPQANILKNANIGGFVSHCGWSSALEAMTFGVPIIAIPMHLDQPINARLVCCESVGVGKEVLRGENGKLEGKVVANVIKEVVMEKSGENIRMKAKEMSQKIIAKGDEEIDDVVMELKKICLGKF